MESYGGIVGQGPLIRVQRFRHDQPVSRVDQPFGDRFTACVPEAEPLGLRQQPDLLITPGKSISLGVDWVVRVRV